MDGIPALTLLWVEGFDLHSPYDCLDEYLELYENDQGGIAFAGERFHKRKKKGKSYYRIFTKEWTELVHVGAFN